MCLPGNATGGGDICVTLCLQRGGGGGGGHDKIFRNVAIFWRFAPLLPKRQKIPTFQKIFSCPPPPPPPPLQTQGYTNVPPLHKYCFDTVFMDSKRCPQNVQNGLHSTDFLDNRNAFYLTYISQAR